MKAQDYKDVAVKAALETVPMNFNEFIDYMAKISPIEFADHQTCEELFTIYLIEVDKITSKEREELFLYYHLGE